MCAAVSIAPAVDKVGCRIKGCVDALGRGVDAAQISRVIREGRSMSGEFFVLGASVASLKQGYLKRMRLQKVRNRAPRRDADVISFEAWRVAREMMTGLPSSRDAVENK